MQRKSFWSFTWPPMTLALCAAMARRQGWEPFILDGSVGGSPHRSDREALRKHLAQLAPDVVIANTGTPSIRSDLALAPLVRQAAPQARMGYLGIHAAEFDREILAAHPAVDFIVRGEPEFTVEALLGAKGFPEGVEGISWRTPDGEIVRNPDRDFETDLARLPPPAWDLVNPSDYRLPHTGRPFLMVSTVRGCPYACSYCHTQKFYGRRLRSRPPADIADEVAHGRNVHGVHDFLFWSELFTADRAHVIRVCSELLKRNLGISWATSSRVDYVDPEMLALMRRAGCWLMAFGVESGNQAVLDANKKKTTVAEAYAAVEMVQAAGIRVAAHFVLGMPGETEASARETIEFAKDLGVDYAQFYCAVPFPGSPLYEQARKEGWLDAAAPWEDYDQTRSVLNYPNGLSARDIERLRHEAYRAFYFRPRMLFKGLRQVRSWGQVRQLVRIAANFA